MANLPISGLTASATNLAAADVLPVVQTTGVGPVKMTGVQLGAGLLSATIPIGSGPFLTRRGAANVQLGAADAAAPVAQTLSVQSVVAGTTNTAGTNFTIAGSQGTGTGAGGSLIFQVAPAGSSGSAQNALATALTINSAGTISANLAGFNVQNNASSPYLIEGTRLIGRSGATISLCDNAYWQTLAFHTNNAVSLALDATGSVRVAKALTVATLPGTPATGMIARVTDALTPVVGSTVTAGGSAQALVWYNGANWTVTGV